MKKKYSINGTFFLIFILLSNLILSQSTFQKVYTGFYGMDGLDAIPAINGGYIITGMTNNDIIDDIDIYIIKTNETGDKIWNKTYGGNKPDYSFGILKATDESGYYVIGYSQSFGGGDYDAWLLKIDINGDTLWSKTYGTWGNDQGKEIIPTSDGNYMIAGFTNGTGGPDYNAWLIKIKPDGEIIWEKKYGGSNIELGNSVKQTIDGGYVLFGQTFSYGSNGDAYLVKTNASGTTEWEKNYGGAHNDEGIFILANPDGTYTFCIRDSSSAGKDIDVQVIKTDGSGSVIWNKKYGGNRKDTDKMIQPTNDGGYVVAAISRSFSFSQLPDMWILKLSPDGDTLWSRSYGGQDNEHCYAVRQTTDGGYIAVGKTESFSTEDGIMFLKLNSQGKLSGVPVEEFAGDKFIYFYPNPSNGNVTIELNDNVMKTYELKVCSALGQTIHSETIYPHQHKKKVDLNNMAPGVYFLNMQSENTTFTQKLIVN